MGELRSKRYILTTGAHVLGAAVNVTVWFAKLFMRQMLASKGRHTIVCTRLLRILTTCVYLFYLGLLFIHPSAELYYSRNPVTKSCDQDASFSRNVHSQEGIDGVPTKWLCASKLSRNSEVFCVAQGRDCQVFVLIF